MSEPIDTTAARRQIERAHSEVGAICKEGARNRWRMSIPAQPDRDSDLIISEALNAGEVALAEVDRLRAELDAAWTVVREGTANMRAQLATVRAERDQARTLAGMRRDERDRLAEQVKRVRAATDSHREHTHPESLGDACDACWAADALDGEGADDEH